MEKLLLRCYVVLIAFALLFMIGCSGHETPRQGVETTEQSAVIPYDPLPSNTKSPIEEGLWQVVSVVDGDTLIIGDSAKQYRVRLIGSDTPEIRRPNTPIEPFGLEASEFVKKRLPMQTVEYVCPLTVIELTDMVEPLQWCGYNCRMVKKYG
jgi:micrococcal nuclease